MGFMERHQLRKDLPLDSRENSALALEVATKSIVLLKNEGPLLPLDKSKLKRIVVYGPDAQDTPAVGGGSGGVEPFRKVSFLEGIREAVSHRTEVFYAPMPDRKKFSISEFLDFGTTAPRSAKITGIKKMTSIDQPGFAKTTTSMEHRIRSVWNKYLQPEDVPKGREARVSWDAIIEAPEGGYYELASQGHPEIRLGDKELGNPESYIMSLAPGSRTPLKVTANEVGRGSGLVSVTVRSVSKDATGIFPARNADAAIVCVGLNPDVEGEGYDRGFTLPVAQQRLIEQVSAANPRTIVVLSGGGAVDMTGWIGKVPAVLQTWYLGQSAGTALAAILFGDADPSGHLPCTFDRTIEENPTYGRYPGSFRPGKEWPVVDYSEGVFYGYRGYDRSGKDPLFPFGHGLSYTSFTMEGMEVTRGDDGVSVTTKLTNTGNREGATVVQVYLSLTEEGTPRPLRELKGFSRVSLKPGESRQVKILIPVEELRYWHPDLHHWVDPTGPMKFEGGFSERDIRQSALLPTPVTKS
jgi:beta-glucosidase